MPNDEPIDVEFIPPSTVEPKPVKCRCPACPVMLDPAGRWCPLCSASCIPALKRIHKAHPVIRQTAGDTKAIVDGVKSAARVVDGALDLVSAFTGKPRRRRLR